MKKMMSVILPILAFSTAIIFAGSFLETESPDYNVILISIDTLRADHLECYGYHRETAPNMCKLAEDGILFETCISQCPWTMPSVMSMITGLYPLKHKIDTYPLEGYVLVLNDSKKTLAELMKDDDYISAAFSGNGILFESSGFFRGVDIFKTEYTTAEVINNYTIGWLEENVDDKFFLWLHYNDPHWYYGAPYPFNETFPTLGRCNITEKDRIRHAFNDVLKEKVSAPECFDSFVSMYDNEIIYTDEMIGEIIKYLQESGVYEKTIIIITSDHGEEFMEHGSLEHTDTNYDEVILVPLIIVHPDYTGGKRIENQVSIIDIMPTVIDFIGIESEIQMDGESLIPIIEDVTNEERLSFTEAGGKRRISVRTKEWKFIYTQNASAIIEDPHFVTDNPDLIELYDMKHDPGEKDNLAYEMVNVSKYFENLVREHFEMYSSDEDDRINAAIDDMFIEQLKTLGYIT